MKAQLHLICMAVMAVTLLGSLQTASAYYDPGVQRWLNRDPIAENAGLNLFEFCLNNPINKLDSFGLVTVTVGKEVPCDRKLLTTCAVKCLKTHGAGWKPQKCTMVRITVEIIPATCFN